MKRDKDDSTYRCKDYKINMVWIDLRAQNGFFASGESLQMNALRALLKTKTYYRVAISQQAFVDVLSLDMQDVDDTLNGMYDDLSDLPSWMQERIAMLNMLSFKPPTETVDGVGRRITEFTYWVQKPDSCD